MNIKSIAEKKEHFAARLVGEELILVPLKDNVADMNEMFTLNDVGSFIWNNINEHNTLEDIKEAIASEFDIDEETAEKDLNEFLNQLSMYLFRNRP